MTRFAIGRFLLPLVIALPVAAACGSTVDMPIPLRDSGTGGPQVDGAVADLGVVEDTAVVEDTPPAPLVGEEALPCAKSGASAMTKSRFVANNGVPASKFTVPKESNPYRCWVYQSPATDSFVSNYAPILDSSEVHHMILYTYTGKAAPFAGATGPVDCKGMPSDVNLQWGWAPGGENYAFPADVSQKIPANTTLIMQIHYNNAHLADATDSSGIAFCAGPDRARHAGVLWTGNVNFSVPAHATNYEVVGTCPPKGWPVPTLPFDLEVLGAFPHMHTHGHKIWTDQLRGGAVIDSLARNDAWDFNAQGFQALSPTKKVLKGDQLVTHCTYDNAGDTPIDVGENTENEMCFDFLYTIPDVTTLYKGADKCVSN